MDSSKGYTIVEVMIFLAVSSILFIGAMVAIGGQQKRVRFSQAMRDLSSKIDDIINDVSAGYYPTTKNMKCDYNPGNGKIEFSVQVSDDIGQNKECILLGKTIHFSPGGNADNINIYTVVGRRTNGGNLSKDLTSALPTMAYSPSGNVDLTDTYSLSSGIKIKSVTTTGTAAGDKGSYMLGFYSSLSGGELATESSGPEKKLQSGSQVVQGVPFDISSPQTDKNAAAAVISAQKSYGFSHDYQYCFASQDDDKETALITIGARGGSLNSKLEFIPC